MFHNIDLVDASLASRRAEVATRDALVGCVAFHAAAGASERTHDTCAPHRLGGAPHALTGAEKQVQEQNAEHARGDEEHRVGRGGPARAALPA